MNNKGEVGVGTIVVVAVALIVGIIFFQAIAQQIGSSTNTITLANTSFTSASEGNVVYLDYKAISSPVVYNATGELVPAANYTVTNNFINPTSGAISVKVTTASVNAYANDTWNISGVAQPVTYISDSGGRALANLITIMFALMLVATALYPFYESKLMEMFGK